MQQSHTLHKAYGFVLGIVLILMPVMSHAGGLGIAPLTFILGSLGLVLSLRTGFKISPPFIALILLLVWATLTAFWSPYETDGFLTNYIKLLIMGPVFFFAPMVFKFCAQNGRAFLPKLFVVTTCLSACLVTIDILSGFKITLFFNPADTTDELARRLSDAEPNLSHAITVLLLLSAPVILVSKAYFKSWKILSSVFLALLLTAAFAHNLAIGVIGVPLVVLTLCLAFRSPGAVTKSVIALGVLSLILAPLIGYLSSLMVNGDLHAFPGSWEHRVRMCAYCWPQILEAPLIGSGFDSVRTFDEEYITRNGIQHTIVSLHPHNFGIHLWTETGFIGVMLACSALVTSYQAFNMRVMNADSAAFISGVFIAALLISLVTYGVWQFWWWASFFFTIGLIHFVSGNQTSKR